MTESNTEAVTKDETMEIEAARQFAHLEPRNCVLGDNTRNLDEFVNAETLSESLKSQLDRAYDARAAELRQALTDEQREAVHFAIGYIGATGENAEHIVALRSISEQFDRRAALTSDVARAPFQSRVQPWMLECFGAGIAGDRIERNHRFFEEATEAVQANGMTRSEAHQLVDYTFDRPVGELHQEIGGVMVTLAALCLASGQDMHAAGESELARIWTKVEAIRAKQAAKPKHSPLPVAPTPETAAVRDVLAERQRQVSVEGWTPKHDDEHNGNQLSMAAACYALEGISPYTGCGIDVKRTWSDTGWSWTWWKPKDRRSNLVKAGALILAEIERLDRLADTAQSDAEKA